MKTDKASPNGKDLEELRKEVIYKGKEEACYHELAEWGLIARRF